MFLMDSSRPCYLEVALSYASDFMKLHTFSIPGTKAWRRCSNNHEHHLDGNGELFSHGVKKDDDLCILNYSSNCSQLSTSCTMPNNFTPTLVYQRKRWHKDSVVTMQPCAVTKSGDACLAASCYEVPTLTPQEHIISREEAGSEEALTTDLDRRLKVVNANDNCSSSKWNLGLSSAALKVDMDDAGECSSSGALVSDKAQEYISERDICISLLRSRGLLDGVCIRQDGASTERNGVCSDNYCSKWCKVCTHMDCTKNLLICDNCEDAFHIACCSPRLTIVPVSEWLCSSCLKKKHKILTDNSSTETCRIEYLASELNLGSLGFMLRDTEPYMSNVRIGDEFQADVPDWSGPVNEESDLSGDPLEIDHSNNIKMREQYRIEPLKLSSICNWLQCREVRVGIGDGVEGTVCGKWRRAPLFEVQTDIWECFRCILWDPAHADCAVPQELETEEVMKQLKYIEMATRHAEMEAIDVLLEQWQESGLTREEISLNFSKCTLYVTCEPCIMCAAALSMIESKKCIMAVQMICLEVVDRYRPCIQVSSSRKLPSTKALQTIWCHGFKLTSLSSLILRPCEEDVCAGSSGSLAVVLLPYPIYSAFSLGFHVRQCGSNSIVP